MAAFTALSAVLPMGSVEADSVALFVGDLTLTVGGVAQIQVFGEVSDASTFGVEILVEVLPRAGNRGTVIFTPSPTPDIVPRDDPWPDAGTFTAFDTDSLGFSPGLTGRSMTTERSWPLP